ncbi:hypothetical protein J6590_019884 [Homalodisca vitripennis]|nr:hypothetical protein J6590_019884 [Homalodisca vitripennis]
MTNDATIRDMHGSRHWPDTFLFRPGTSGALSTVLGGWVEGDRNVKGPIHLRVWLASLARLA